MIISEYTRTGKLSVSAVKQAAAGRWPEILERVGGIPAESLTGKNGPCPKCTGTDRFRFIKQDVGAVLCNVCFKTGNGDGIAAVQWATGCTFPEALKLISDYLGIQNGNGKSRSNGKPKIVKEYDYHDADGELLFQVVRFDPKDFRQRKPDGNDGWNWKVAGVKQVPYRLPELIQRPDEVVFIVEGEKDVDRLHGLGTIATCNSGGAGKWRAGHAGYLQGRNVAILPDNDQAGRDHADKVARSLVGVATSIKIVRLPDLADKGDLSDWLDAGRTVEQLRTLADAVDEWTPTAVSVSTPSNPAELLSGRLDPATEARAFLSGETLDGVPLLRFWRGSWWRWIDGKYSELSNAEVKSAVMLALNKRHDAVSNRVTGDVLAQVQAHNILPSRTETPEWLRPLPGDPVCENLLTTKSSLIDLIALVENREFLYNATPRLFSTTATNYEFDPSAERPDKWLAFLADLWQDDQQSIDALQEWFGYFLTPDTRQQKMLLVVGPKRSGKGTIARVVRQLVGPSNVAGPTLSSLAANFGLQPLIGKTLSIISDARLGRRTDSAIVTERLLSISGEDALTIDRKFQEPITAKLTTRFMILTNELPRLDDSSGALAGRMQILRLTNSFYGKEDHALSDSLLTELPGILLWAVEGWRRLRERGRFNQSDTGIDLASELSDLTSPVGAFVADQCEIGPSYTVAIKDIFDAWREWCVSNGMLKSGTQQTFGRDLMAAVPSIRRFQPNDAGKRYRAYQGIRLLSEC